MTYLDSAILGIIQGLTEFIPVSSTGHLILVREFFNISGENGLAIDAFLQLGTVLAVLVYFWKEILNLVKSAVKLSLGRTIDSKDRILLIAIVAGTIPAIILGLLLESKMEGFFRQGIVVALGLILGSVLFVVAERVSKRFSGNRELTVGKGFVVGLFQSLALIPGMSRSGSTISGSLIMGLSRNEAAKFSFLLSFPIIAGSGLLKLKDLIYADVFGHIGGQLLLGFALSFVFGVLAINFLIRYISSHSLMAFVWYRLVLAGIILWFI